MSLQHIGGGLCLITPTGRGCNLVTWQSECQRCAPSWPQNSCCPHPPHRAGAPCVQSFPSGKVMFWRQEGASQIQVSCLHSKLEKGRLVKRQRVMWVSLILFVRRANTFPDALTEKVRLPQCGDTILLYLLDTLVISSCV